MKHVLLALAAAAPIVVHAGQKGLDLNSIPAVDDLGLALLIALVATVAGWAVRHRSRK